ncbi:SNF2-related protein [Halomonas sp. KO116]|uniref:SNF2-related protein n=1 Tax=Halomonas sp. KO116 TaxID=1504981 RepID=UPI0004E45CB0|nr:DEAD/DEAH box helicase [Halomonas sp. KO116]AJY53303.1 SNF2-related protein [Halomonas sp. KO116]
MGHFNWTILDELASRGSRATKAQNMGGLHAKRKETLSQFFTPAWVVKAAWSLISPAFAPGCRYRLLDNSIGAGSMFRFAQAEQHTLHGLDVDQELIDAVTDRLDAAGYQVDIKAIPMEDAVLGQYSAALINPPFSITLSSPNLTPFPGVTTFGKHGPHTSALSHEYALAQALDNADIVAAVVPRTTTQRLTAGELGDLDKRLVAVYRLPANAFTQENVVSVTTDLLIFGEPAQQAKWHDGGTLSPDALPSPLPTLLACREERMLKTKPVGAIGVDEGEPVVSLPVTGDTRVVMDRAGRHIKLTFHDAATEVRVKNALWESRLISNELHRYSPTTRYAGQYRLSLDAIVLQKDPMAALESVAARITEAGGNPTITAQLRHGVASLVKEHQQMSIPYGRWVYRKGTPSFSATAKRLAMIDKRQRTSVVAMGETVTALRSNDGFNVTTARGVFAMNHDAFFSLFDMEEQAASADYWEAIHPPIREHYPQRISQLEAQARALGLDRWLTWDFQLEDLCELAFRPVGGVCAWQMALGKTRLILALALLQPGKSLIVVKSRLVDELMRELALLKVPADHYQAITRASDLASLSKINIVSYESIRRPLNVKWPKLTLARRLKGRFANIYCDEGGLLSNAHSQQTQAVWSLGGKKHYVFDGTPMANYPRDMLPLACWTMGAERSYQPYSVDAGFMYPELFNSAYKQSKGRQEFHNHYVTMAWSTNEFHETGQGAKREIPKIRSAGLARFRQWLSPMVKRRVQQEPDVARHVSFPVPTLHEPIAVEWDIDHLVTYVQTVEEFADWYRDYQERTNADGKSLNLTIILQRLEACFKAANAPHTLSGVVAPYLPTTSKQRACIDLIVKEVGKGRRPIVFARNPSTLERLKRLLDSQGITSMVFTGAEGIKARTKRLNAEIREGDTQVMLASLGVTQDGLNLPEMNTFIFYNRSFKAREEFQGIFRLLRAAQTKDVYGYFLHLAGSLDDYQGQLIHWKALASESGLDYGEGMDDDAEFVHFDAVLQRFIASLPGLKDKIDNLRQRQRAA